MNNENLEKKVLNKLRKEIFNNKSLISLGYNCNPKCFINVIKEKSETQLFDWIGTTIWGINNLVKNNFSDILNEDKLTDYTFDNYITSMNPKYFFRFYHQRIKQSENKLSKLFNFSISKQYERRIKRFIDLMESDNDIIFLVLEENLPNRIETLPEEAKEYFPSSNENYHEEQHNLNKKYIKEFCEIISEKYGKENIRVLYFSEYQSNTETNGKVLFLNIKNLTERTNDIFKLARTFTKSIVKNFEEVKNHCSFE